MNGAVADAGPTGDRSAGEQSAGAGSTGEGSA